MKAKPVGFKRFAYLTAFFGLCFSVYLSSTGIFSKEIKISS